MILAVGTTASDQPFTSLTLGSVPIRKYLSDFASVEQLLPESPNRSDGQLSNTLRVFKDRLKPMRLMYRGRFQSTGRWIDQS